MYPCDFHNPDVSRFILCCRLHAVLGLVLEADLNSGYVYNSWVSRVPKFTSAYWCYRSEIIVCTYFIGSGVCVYAGASA